MGERSCINGKCSTKDRPEEEEVDEKSPAEALVNGDFGWCPSAYEIHTVRIRLSQSERVNFREMIITCICCGLYCD